MFKLNNGVNISSCSSPVQFVCHLVFLWAGRPGYGSAFVLSNLRIRRAQSHVRDYISQCCTLLIFYRSASESKGKKKNFKRIQFGWFFRAFTKLLPDNCCSAPYLWFLEFSFLFICWASMCAQLQYIFLKCCCGGSGFLEYTSWHHHHRHTRILKIFCILFLVYWHPIKINFIFLNKWIYVIMRQQEMYWQICFFQSLICCTDVCVYA